MLSAADNASFFCWALIQDAARMLYYRRMSGQQQQNVARKLAEMLATLPEVQLASICSLASPART